MGSTFADPPAAGFFVDDPETVTTGSVRIALANLGSKCGAFIDHFDSRRSRSSWTRITILPRP
jgi:hypothetical protein